MKKVVQALLVLAVISSCRNASSVDPNPDIIKLGWQNVSASFGELPVGIDVYKCPDEIIGIPAIAYCSVIDLEKNTWNVSSISDPDCVGTDEQFKTPAQRYSEEASPIIVNAGYFYADSEKRHNVSVAVSEGKSYGINLAMVSENGEKLFYPTRGIFMEHPDHSIDVAWCYGEAGKGVEYVYNSPAQNAWDNEPLQKPDANFPEKAIDFDAVTAIGAGPVLLKDGKIVASWKAELFYGNNPEDKMPLARHPRTAIGKRADGKLVLFVCEGRQMTEGIEGLNFEELATVMQSLGCTDALNLDGGGSSCLLVNGNETIKPSDGHERPVASMVYITPKPEPKPRFLWIDQPANARSYLNDADSIARDCKRIAKMGFTDIVVDVRPTSGEMIFKRTEPFDYLGTFIREGHAAGLKVHAGVNMMVGGQDYKEWCAVDLLPDGRLVSQADNYRGYGACFLDPANPEVQDYLLKMLGDLASHKGLDGIIMDRCRYDDYAMDAGYTEAAYGQFTEYIGHEPERWPVFTEPGHIFLDKVPDELETQWLTFRCKVIHDFVEKAVAKVHKTRADLPLGIYVGAWFSEYYRSGVNWTSPSYDLAAEEPAYAWATPEYQATGFADIVDYMILGAYCPAANVHGDVEKTMEGFAKLGRKRLCGDVPFYSGPDIGNEPGFPEGGKGYLMPEIVKTMTEAADGLFVFDLCHIRMHNYWDSFNE